MTILFNKTNKKCKEINDHYMEISFGLAISSLRGNYSRAVQEIQLTITSTKDDAQTASVTVKICRTQSR